MVCMMLIHSRDFNLVLCLWYIHEHVLWPSWWMRCICMMVVSSMNGGGHALAVTFSLANNKNEKSPLEISKYPQTFNLHVSCLKNYSTTCGWIFHFLPKRVRKEVQKTSKNLVSESGSTPKQQRPCTTWAWILVSAMPMTPRNVKVHGTAIWTTRSLGTLFYPFFLLVLVTFSIYIYIYI